MVDNIELSAISQKDLGDSAEWYEEQSPGLGIRFADMIYRSIGLISQHPELYPKKKGQRREYVVETFPFVIIFEFSKKERSIYILRIFHTSRNPRNKYRLKIKRDN